MSGREIRNRTESTAGRDSLSPELIHLILEKLKIEITDSLANQMIEYIDLLFRWNQKISLTSVRDPALLVEWHFGESLFGAISVGIESGDLLDVGSGAGFPALPIAMLRPGLRETLLEPNGKKAAFLSEVCRRLNLSKRVKVVRCRVEEFRSVAKFDFITSRALRVTASFLDHCSQLLRPDGKLVLWVSHKEAKATTENSSWKWVSPIRVSGSEQRYVISGSPKMP